MKKRLSYILILLALLVQASSFAAEFRGGQQVSVGRNEVVNNDLYVGGSNVNVFGSVSDDLTAAGGTVIVSGNVGADLTAAGGNVNVLSSVGDDVRVAGGTIVVSGPVGGDLLAAGGQVSVSGSVAGDAAITGGTISIEAPISGKLNASGGSVYLNSEVTGNVSIEADKITLGKDAIISGNLVYTSKTEMVKENGAVVLGKVDFKKADKPTSPTNNVLRMSILSLLWAFATLLACSLAVGLLHRRYGNEIVTIAQGRPLYEIGRGLLTLLVVPIASVLLLISVLGVPLGLAGILLFLFLFFAGWVMSPIIAGSIAYSYLMKSNPQVSWKTIILGVAICIVIGLIPVIGFLFDVCIFLLSLGCVVALAVKGMKEWR